MVLALKCSGVFGRRLSLHYLEMLWRRGTLSLDKIIHRVLVVTSLRKKTYYMVRKHHSLASVDFYRYCILKYRRYSHRQGYSYMALDQQHAAARWSQIQQQHITIIQASKPAIERPAADQAATNRPPRLAWIPTGWRVFWIAKKNRE